MEKEFKVTDVVSVENRYGTLYVVAIIEDNCGKQHTAKMIISDITVLEAMQTGKLIFNESGLMLLARGAWIEAF